METYTIYRACFGFNVYFIIINDFLSCFNNKTWQHQHGEEKHSAKIFHSTYEAEHRTGFISASSVLCLTEHTGGAHSATWAELNGLWSKGLIKRRHTTCPLALHFVHSGFMGKTMQARFPTRIGDLLWTTIKKKRLEEKCGNKRCGL